MRAFLWLVLYVHLAILTFASAGTAVGSIIFGAIESPWFFFATPVTIAVTVALGMATAWAVGRATDSL